MEKFIQLAKTVQKYFPDFYLAGGTALVLKFGHRESVDLEFFKEKPFSFQRLALKVRNTFNIQKEEKGEDNIDFYVEGVKISFIFFPFKNIENLEVVKGIKKASDYDIFLNKIYSAGRRIEPRDPIDCAFLYKTYRWDKDKIQADFERKFPHQSYKIYLGALLHFEDYPELPKWVKEELLKLL